MLANKRRQVLTREATGEPETNRNPRHLCPPQHHLVFSLSLSPNASPSPPPSTYSSPSRPCAVFPLECPAAAQHLCASSSPIDIPLPPRSLPTALDSPAPPPMFGSLRQPSLLPILVRPRAAPSSSPLSTSGRHGGACRSPAGLGLGLYNHCRPRETGGDACIGHPISRPRACLRRKRRRHPRGGHHCYSWGHCPCLAPQRVSAARCGFFLPRFLTGSMQNVLVECAG